MALAMDDSEREKKRSEIHQAGSTYILHPNDALDGGSAYATQARVRTKSGNPSQSSRGATWTGTGDCEQEE